MEVTKTNNYYKNKIKLELCTKYYLYLLAIDAISNGSGVALQEQVVNVMLGCFERNVKKETILRKLLELKKADVIKEQRFVKNSRFLILKKFAIRYLKNELITDSVASIPIPNSNSTYYRNIFKSEYFLRELVPFIRNEGQGACSIEEILKYRCTSYFINEETFMWNLMENFFFEVNKEEIKKDAKFFKNKRELQRKVLNREISTAVFPDTEEFNVSNLTAKNAIVNTCTLNGKKSEIRVKINYLDYRDRQDIEDIIYVYSISYAIFRRLIKFNYNVYIDMKVCTNSIQACQNIKEKLLRVKAEDATGKHTKLDELLNKYNAPLAFLRIELENYDIENKYFK